MKTNYLFVGLGNPGEEYVDSRHSLGRMVLLDFAKKEAEIKDWKLDKKLKAQITEGKSGKNKFRLLLPENFMNNSGGSVKPLIKNKNEAHELVVIHDDIDLPLGRIKICYNRGSGGHKGVESIIKALKTNEFIRLRMGVAQTTTSGKLKKPADEDKFVDFIIAKFKPAEQDELKKVIKKAKQVVASLVENGLERTMNEFNSHEK